MTAADQCKKKGAWRCALSALALCLGATAIAVFWGALALAHKDAKVDAVANALARQSADYDESVVLSAARDAEALTRIEAIELDGRPCLRIEVTGEPALRQFTLDDGRKVVLDIKNTVNLVGASAAKALELAGAQAVRTSLFAIHPELISRVVIDLDEPISADIRQQPGEILVVLPAGSAEKEPPERETRPESILAALREAFQADAAAAAEYSAAVRERADAATAPDADDLSRLNALLDKSAGLVSEGRGALARQAGASGDFPDILAELEQLLTHGETLARHVRQSREGLKTKAAEYEASLQRQVENNLMFLDAFAEAARTEADGEERLMAAAQRLDALRRDVLAEELAELKRLAEQPAPGPVNDLEELTSVIGRLEAQASAVEARLTELRIDKTDQRQTGAAPVEIALAELDAAIERERDGAAAASRAPASDQHHGEQPRLAMAANTEQSPRRVFLEARDANADRMAALTSELEAVKDAQIDLSFGAIGQFAAAGDTEAEEYQPEWWEDPYQLYEMDPDEEPAPADAPVDALDAEPVDEAAPEEEPLPADDVDADEDVTPIEEADPDEEPTPIEDILPDAPAPRIVHETIAAPDAVRPEYRPGDDPLHQPVNVDFREMELANVVSLMAERAQVNVVAGAELTGTVTANLRNVPLRQAFEIVLQMNNLGIIEEAGVFRIVPYLEAEAANRVRENVYLDKASANDLRDTLEGVVSGDQAARLMSFTANDAANILIIAGPPRKVEYYAELARELDVAEPMLPTVTEAIRLNYLEPTDILPIVQSVLSDDVGQVEPDVNGRHLVVTDMPVVIEKVRGLINDIDLPVKQVAIEAMIVDAVLRDASQTGVNWLFESVRRRNRRGETVGNLDELVFDANLGPVGAGDLNAGIIDFAVLSSRIDFRGAIAAEVQSRNAEILANPVVVTMENKPANISIVQEFPYQEITQATTGPPIASTEFKDIGVTLDVIPRVTHDNDILVEVDAKQSSISGISDTGVPIEDKRQAGTSLRTANGQTIFIGGLRNIADRQEYNKVPVLGDIPVLNFMFRHTDIEKVHTELMVFLTCRVVEDVLPPLSDRQAEWHGKLEHVPETPSSERTLYKHLMNPDEMREPFWRLRRSGEKVEPIYDPDGYLDSDGAEGAHAEDSEDTTAE